MAQYERFDDDTPSPKFTIVTSTNNENVELLVSPNSTLPNEDDTTTRDALITLNIISVIVSSVCGLITFFLAVEEQSSSALSFAIDTILDVLTFLIIIWRFMNSSDQQKERNVIKILAIIFLISGLAVFIDSLRDIVKQTHPILNQYLAVAVVVQAPIFFCLSIAKYAIARKLQAISAYSDAFNTFIAGLMALSVAISVATYNSNPTVWYIDPLIGMFISVTIIGYGAWMIRVSFKKT